MTRIVLGVCDNGTCTARGEARSPNAIGGPRARHTVIWPSGARASRAGARSHPELLRGCLILAGVVEPEGTPVALDDAVLVAPRDQLLVVGTARLAAVGEWAIRVAGLRIVRETGGGRVRVQLRRALRALELDVI